MCHGHHRVISRVRIKNYKSIASCDVRLGPLTILVGPNGVGKSNFLDALSLLARALGTTPNEAISSRGGIAEIVCRVPVPTDSFSIAVDVNLPWGVKAKTTAYASYMFEVARKPAGGPNAFEIMHEECELRRSGQVFWRFRVGGGHVLDETRDPQDAEIPPDRLYLQQTFNFEPLFRRLQEMRFYNFSLDVLRKPQQRSSNAILDSRGEYLPDVLGALRAEGAGYKERVDDYLRAIMPDAVGIDQWLVGGTPFTTVMLRFLTGYGGREKVFGPDGISDGTIRAAAVLAALFQPAVRNGQLNLIGIEEPEIALHPAAAGVLFDALSEASEYVQVIAATQSADLLDREDLDASLVRAVTMRDGLTIIGEIDDASREIAGKKLHTLGELMRGDQFVPKTSDDQS